MLFPVDKDYFNPSIISILLNSRIQFLNTFFPGRYRMTIERQRLLELALEHLQERKIQVEQELEQVQAELNASRSSTRSQQPKRTRRKRRKMTPEERKAHSKRMKQYWAERKKRERAESQESGS